MIDYSLCTLLLLLLSLLEVSLIFSTRDAEVDKLLRAGLQRPILADDFFKANFSTYNLLKMVPDKTNIGIELTGESSREALHTVFRKAMSGQNVSLLILGGSSTQGADLGSNNRLQTFHAGLVSWWQHVITPITGSHLNRRAVAIGGIGTAYMSYCWKEYVKDSWQSIDMIIWEFFINDPDCFLDSHYGGAVERFMKTTMEIPSHPVLLFVKFFRPNIFPGEILKQCQLCEKHKMKSSILLQKLKAYRITALDLLLSTCKYIKRNPTIPIKKQEFFIQHHPSHLAHAQMAFLIINYISNTFQQSLSAPSLGGPTVAQTITSQAQHNSVRNCKCFTGILPHVPFKNVDSIFDLQLVWNNGYLKKDKPTWDQSIAHRSDLRGGYISKQPGASIGFLLDATDVVVLRTSNIHIVISHQKVAGMVTIVVRASNGGDGGVAKSVDCSQETYGASTVHLVAEAMTGTIQVEFYDPIGGCLLNAIIVEAL